MFHLPFSTTLLWRECNRDEMLYNYGNEELISHPGHFTAREGDYST